MTIGSVAKRDAQGFDDEDCCCCICAEFRASDQATPDVVCPHCGSCESHRGGLAFIISDRMPISPCLPECMVAEKEGENGFWHADGPMHEMQRFNNGLFFFFFNLVS